MPTLVNSDAGLNEHIQGKGVFRYASPEVQTELTAAVSDARLIKKFSKEEFVALIVDEATNMSAKTQTSTDERRYEVRFLQLS